MKTLICVLFGCGLLALVGRTLPLGDDWCYLTVPNLEFGWESIAPGMAFWRPFDALLGGLLGHFPWAFPLLNRVIIILGHVLNVIAIGHLMKRLIPSADKIQSLLAMSYFALSSATAAVIVNTDSMNQVLSVFFGICALNVFLRSKTWLGIAQAGGLVFVSMLFKESGISWLGVMACMACFANVESGARARMLRVAKVYCMSLAVVAVYFGVRFCLRGYLVLGSGSDYALGFSPIKIVRDLAINIVPSLTAIDVLAFVCHKWGIAICTIVLSFVFWLTIFWGVVQEGKGKRRELMAWLVLCILIAVVLALPHCFFKNLHPAEMHFYPVMFAGVLLVSRVKFSGTMKEWCVYGVMLLLFAVGWCDKLAEAYAYSGRTEALLGSIKRQNFDFSKPVYLIVENDEKVNRYSGFTQSAAHGIYFGAALRSLNDWRSVEYHAVLNEKEVPENAQRMTIK